MEWLKYKISIYKQTLESVYYGKTTENILMHGIIQVLEDCLKNNKIFENYSNLHEFIDVDELLESSKLKCKIEGS